MNIILSQLHLLSKSSVKTKCNLIMTVKKGGINAHATGFKDVLITQAVIETSEWRYAEIWMPGEREINRVK